MKQLISLTLFLSIISMTACKKEEGPGGTASIKGKVFLQEYNSSFTNITTEYYAPDVDVFIIYGNEDNIFDDRTRTSYDGSFQFKNLQKGDYRVFAYSKDSSGAADGNPTELNPDKAIIKSINIASNKSENNIGDIIILD
ncbi:MAG: hypothetical protein RIQ89_2193 [Bacteroidota bacterium]